MPTLEPQHQENTVHRVSAAGRILVVEDDTAVARLVAAALRREGHRVEVANSVEQARALIRSQSFELVVLDRRLPDGSGLSLLPDLSTLSRPVYLLMLTAASGMSPLIEALDGGIDDYMTKPFHVNELNARVRAGLRIVELQKRLVDQNRDLERLSVTDALTQLYNRRHFDAELERSFTRARRYGNALSLAIIDADHFKAINDTWGHAAGDAALREIAARIRGSVRGTDTVGRIGGEEIGVILPEAGLLEGLQVCEKIRSEIASAPVRLGDRELHVTVSAGLVSHPQTTLTSPEQMLVCADDALYRAKRRGRNRVDYERRANPRVGLRPSAA